MRRLLLGLSNYKTILVIAILFSGVMACKKDGIKKASEDLTNKPSLEIFDFENIQSEKGVLKNRIKADVMEGYDRVDTPYYVFPKGIYACSYKDSIVEADMVADSAVYKSTIGFFVAYGNVVVTNYVSNTTLKTDGPIYWNSEIKKVYTDAYAIVINPPDTLPALNGLIAEDDFSSYELRNNRDGVTYVNMAADSTQNNGNDNLQEKSEVKRDTTMALPNNKAKPNNNNSNNPDLIIDTAVNSLKPVSLE